MSKNLSYCVGWDFRLNESKKDASKWLNVDLFNCLKKFCKNFIFQLEQGESGLRHFQGRLKLFKKDNKKNLLNLFISGLNCSLSDAPQFLTPSCNSEFGNKISGKFDYDCYASKSQSRIGDIVTDRTEKTTDVYIPKQFRVSKLFSFQNFIRKDQSFDDRKANAFYNPSGNAGKSTIAHLCALFKGGIVAPPLNDAEKIVQSICNELIARKIRNTIDIFIDMPRCMNKDKLYGLYSAIEQIKRGYVYDTRYEFTKWYFDCPRIWIFTNTFPDTNLLSKDMWNIFVINNKKEAIPVYSYAEATEYLNYNNPECKPEDIPLFEFNY